MVPREAPFEAAAVNGSAQVVTLHDWRQARIARGAMPDLWVKLNRFTREFTYYREHTQGFLSIAPTDFMHKRVEDVLPSHQAEQIIRSIWDAIRTGSAQRYDYTVKDTFHRQAHLWVNGEDVHIHARSK